MLHHLGIALQIAVLAAMPMLIAYQLMFGFNLIIMPTCTVIGIAMFGIGSWLRERYGKS
jgi:hypothetical protein